MSLSRKAGRSPTYSVAQRTELAAMIRQHGARGTCERTELPICLQTVLQIAREFQVPLKKGRRSRRAA